MTGLGDRHPYVRRSAVMGVLKVAHIDPASVQQHGACWATAGMCHASMLGLVSSGWTRGLGLWYPKAPGNRNTPLFGCFTCVVLGSGLDPWHDGAP